METAGTNNIYYFDGSDFSPFSYRDMDSLAENSIAECEWIGKPWASSSASRYQLRKWTQLL